MNGTRFLKIVIVVLLLINIATLATIWFKRPPMPEAGMGMPPRQDAAAFIIHELQFTPQQIEQFETLKHEHHRQVEAIHEKDRDFHHHFFAQLHSTHPDTIEAHRWADSIALNHKQTELVTLRHFIKVRALCTPGQQTKFDAIIDDALRMVNPPPPPPHH